MIKEERVKQLYKIALYEQGDQRQKQEIGHYYKADYVSKELIKSIFTGTFAFGCFVILWLLSTWEDVLDSINNLQIIDTAIEMLVIYAIFMAVYLVATYLLYCARYEAGRKKLKEYTSDLKQVQKMYEREEKLKL